MIRMGRGSKPDQADTEHNDDTLSQPNTLYPSNTYQSTDNSYRQASAETPTATRAISESETLARDIKEGVLSGYVGNGTILTGEATFKAMLRVDGLLSGNVSSEAGTLIVGTNGQVDADIKVAVANIHGTVNGDIVASQRLELGRAAKVNGNIQTPSLVIEQGAVFEGSCRMVQVKADQEKSRSFESTSSSEVLDTTSMQPVTDESSDATPDYSSVSDVAS